MQGEHQVYVHEHAANGTMCGELLPDRNNNRTCTNYPTGGLYGQTVRIWTPVMNTTGAQAETCAGRYSDFCTTTLLIYG
jgi:hypothetical protein